MKPAALLRYKRYYDTIPYEFQPVAMSHGYFPSVYAIKGNISAVGLKQNIARNMQSRNLPYLHIPEMIRDLKYLDPNYMSLTS